MSNSQNVCMVSQKGIDKNFSSDMFIDFIRIALNFFMSIRSAGFV